LGWALVVFGLVGGNVGLLKETSLRASRPGLILACAGFAVACLAPLATYLSEKEAAEEAIFYFGFALVLIGLALQFVKVFQDRSARKE
jgi:hypothetical protein